MAEDMVTNQHVRCVVSMATMLSYVIIYLTKSFQVSLARDRGGQSYNTFGNSNLVAFCTTKNTNPFAKSEIVIDPNWYIDSGATNHVMA